MIISTKQKEIMKKTFIDSQQTMAMIENGIIFEKAEGLYCWDTEGKRYFDAIGGVFAATLGHRPPELLDAMREQMEKAVFCPPLHGISEITLQFIEKMASITPGDLNFVKAYSGGSEANESAFKFARQYFNQTGHPLKYKFISTYLSYHGATMAVETASGIAPRKTKFGPELPGFLKVPNPIQLRDSFSSWEETNRFCADWIEKVVISENPETVAAIFLEPISNTAGIVKPTMEYFKKVRAICDKYNILLIFDEVLTGFVKTGKMFASELFDVIPDIMTSGKGLSGGVFPMGVMVAREKMGAAFLGKPEDHVQFFHGHTWAANPLGSAVGIATIDLMLKRKLAERAVVLGDQLVMGLEKLKKYGVIREIRGSGVLRGVELVNDNRTNAQFPENAKLGNALKKTAVKNGLIMRIDPNWFAVCPPLIAEKEDIEELLSLVEKSLVEALEIV